jgi:hypothetical protein
MQVVFRRRVESCCSNSKRGKVDHAFKAKDQAFLETHAASFVAAALRAEGPLPVAHAEAVLPYLMVRSRPCCLQFLVHIISEVLTSCTYCFESLWELLGAHFHFVFSM